MLLPPKECRSYDDLILGKTEEVQTFSFETGDDEKYELIEGGHTFHSEVHLSIWGKWSPLPSLGTESL